MTFVLTYKFEFEFSFSKKKRNKQNFTLQNLTDRYVGRSSRSATLFLESKIMKNVP